MKDLYSKAKEVEVKIIFSANELINIVEEHLKMKGVDIKITLDFDDYDIDRYVYLDPMEWDLEDEEISALSDAGYTELSLGIFTPQLMEEIFDDVSVSYPQANAKPYDDYDNVDVFVTMSLEKYNSIMK